MWADYEGRPTPWAAGLKPQRHVGTTITYDNRSGYFVAARFLCVMAFVLCHEHDPEKSQKN